MRTLRIDRAHLETLLKGMGFKADAGETAAFARSLEFIMTKTYDVRYTGLKARKFIPVDSSVPSGAESFTWRGWDWTGMARILANFADDLPKVDAQAAEVTQGIKSIGAQYGYTLQDLRAAAMQPGMSLDQRRAQAARRAIENKIENIAAKGDTLAGLPGFLNNSNVPLLTAGGGVITGNFKASTPSQVLQDLHAIANQVVVTTKESHTPNTMLFPIGLFSYLSTTAMSVNDNRPIMKVFLENSPYITDVDQWAFLDTANAAGNGFRIVCYEKSDEVLGLVIPQEFEQLPPQPKGLSFEIPCHSRNGGVSIRYPLAIIYADGV